MTKVIQDDLHANFTPASATPGTRPIGTAPASFQPDTGRPCFVSYSIQITQAVGANPVTGRVELRSDANSTPTTVRAIARQSGDVGGLLTNLTQSVTIPISYWVPAGHYVRLVEVNEAGTPTYALSCQTEISF